MPEVNKKSTLLKIGLFGVGIGAGIVMGANWPKIKKHLKPYMKDLGDKGSDISTGVVKFFAEKMEKIEDAMAEAKVTKTKTENTKTSKPDS